jgi:Flp pilus assembly protein TadD
MKVLAFSALGVLALAGCAGSQSSTLVERGYQPGALGVAAIDRGDWAAAEKGLMEKRGVSAEDPARLINLGTVYMETGRRGEALSAWRLALASDRHREVETIDGRLVSTEDLARQALAMYETDVRSASADPR